MSGPMRGLVVALSGLATTVVTAFVIALIEQASGVNLSTVSLWVVIPVGALATGAASASGFFGASLLLHTRTSLALYAQMVVAAGVSFFLIHYIGYRLYTFDDGTPISQAVGFFPFLSAYLGDLEVTIRSIHIPAGTAGYWLSAYHALAFMLGAWMLFYRLEQQPLCEPCQSYRRQITRQSRHFDSLEQVHAYRNGLADLVPGSSALTERLESGEVYERQHPMEARITVFECPKCRQWLWRDTVHTRGEREAWPEVEEERRETLMPHRPGMIEALRRN